MHYYRAKRTDCVENPSRRFIGVEIEADRYNDEGKNIAEAADKWCASIVSDGSLGPGSFELVTSPANGDMFCKMISELGNALRKDKAAVSRECGLHVHIDARDYTFYDMRRLIHLYEALEPALFKTQPNDRHGNHYCSPCGKKLSNGLAEALRPKDSKKKVLENVYCEPPSRRTPRRRGDKYDGARYAALNLHSWLHRGTIECRMHSGSVNPRKIKAWGMLWADILDYALRVTEREIKDKASRMTPEKAKAWLLSIAKTRAVRDYLLERWSKYQRNSQEDGGD